MVDYSGIALDGPVHGQIAPKTSICYLFVLKYFDSCFNGLNSGTTSSEDPHTYTGRPVEYRVSVMGLLGSKIGPDLLATGFEMNFLVYSAVIASSSVYEDSRNRFRPTFAEFVGRTIYGEYVARTIIDGYNAIRSICIAKIA